MECLLPTVIIYLRIINTYFTTSRLLTHSGVRNIQAPGVLKKNRLRNALSLGSHNRKNRMWQLWISYIMKKNSANLTVVGWSNNRVVYKASSKSFKPKIFVWCFNKIERSIFKNNIQINSTVTTRTQAFSTGTLPRQWLVSKWKNGGVSACLNGWSYSSECVGVVSY